MAASSISANLIHFLPLSNSSSSPFSKPKLSSLPLVCANCSLKPRALKLSFSSTRVNATAEMLESQSSLETLPEALDGSASETVEVIFYVLLFYFSFCYVMFREFAVKMPENSIFFRCSFLISHLCANSFFRG